MTITTANYLDVVGFVINELIGDVWLAYLIGAIALTLFLMKQGVSWKPIFSLLVIYNFIFVAFAYNVLIAMLTLIPLALLGYKLYSNAIAKG